MKKEYNSLTWHPWNAGYATPERISKEDYQSTPIPEGLPGGWPARQENFKMTNYYETPLGADAPCCGPCGRGMGDFLGIGLDLPTIIAAGAGAALGYKASKKNTLGALAGGFAGAFLAAKLLK